MCEIAGRCCKKGEEEPDPEQMRKLTPAVWHVAVIPAGVWRLEVVLRALYYL